MDKNASNFTIFLPVKNGGEYLSSCVASILAQTYQDFELVILENQSTDGTAEWLQTLEKKDPRIKVIPSSSPLSIEDNWKRILTVPKNKYMTIIGHDDLLEADFLAEINTLIQGDPEASLYQTHFKLIDNEGNMIRLCKPIPKYETAAEFLASRMAEIRDSFGTGYVMQSNHYEIIGGIPTFSDLLFADDALWLGLMGTSFKVTSPRICFSYRLHSGSVSGKPNPEALFNGMKQYLALLRDFGRNNDDLAYVIKLYCSQYVARRCQDYYCNLLETASWGKKVDASTYSELEKVMTEFAQNIPLVKQSPRLILKGMPVGLRTILKRIWVAGKLRFMRGLR